MKTSKDKNHTKKQRPTASKNQYPYSASYRVNKKWFKAFYKNIDEANKFMKYCTENKTTCFITDRKTKKIISENL